MDRLMRIACQSDATLLITGETGTGKSSLARSIHENGSRKGRPFVTVNLASVHEGTLESELFGHERGAFTGADHRRVGKLEMAQGGTVFLDEVGELTPRLQSRLLEFLQSRAICPVGSNREIRLDVRVIAATHRDLDAAVAKGAFREDLLHRLRVVPLGLRPLRERAEDFDRLLHDCLAAVTAQVGRPVFRIRESVARELEGYHWPGNFRELRNVLEFAVHSAEGTEITLEDLPDWFRKARSRLQAAGADPSAPALEVAEVPFSMSFRDTITRFERQYLLWALNRCGGKVNQTARRIGMNKTTLIRRMKTFQIKSRKAAVFAPNG